MQFDFNQTPNTIQKNINSNANSKNEPTHSVINNGIKPPSSPSEEKESDEDPLLNEGYLPEIYFSLKSDNPADW